LAKGRDPYVHQNSPRIALKSLVATGIPHLQKPQVRDFRNNLQKSQVRDFRKRISDKAFQKDGIFLKEFICFPAKFLKELPPC
jgi:hypothetical protein